MTHFVTKAMSISHIGAMLKPGMERNGTKPIGARANFNFPFVQFLSAKQGF